MRAIPFFEGYTGPEIVIMLVSVLVFIIPGAGPRALNHVKNALKLKDVHAHLFVFGLIVVLELAANLVTGVFADVKFNLSTILSQIVTAAVPAEIAYQRLRLRAPWWEGDGKPVEGGKTS